MERDKKSSFVVQARRYVLVGLFTLIPIWLTLLLLSVMLNFINDLVEPLLKRLTTAFKPGDALYSVITNSYLQTPLSVVLLLSILYLVGWLASRWLGQRLLTMFDSTIKRIPIANSIYKTIKRLADTMQTKSDDFERVVLIEFPSADMKTVGLVTRTFKDSTTGRELAAVYVPTTPNPTSGYLEIVPVENIIPTNWKFDEAMSFIISGGADIPATFNYDKPKK